MARLWSDVVKSSGFRDLSAEEQEEARAQYFDSVIAPQVPAEDVSLAREQFDAQTKPHGTMRRVADVGVDLAKGVVGLGESVVGIADLISAGAAGEALSSIGYDPQRTREILSGYYSNQRKLANQYVADADGFLETAYELARNPSALAGAVTEAVPGTLSIAALGRTVAIKAFETGSKAALAAGASEEAARQAGVKAVQAALPRVLTTVSAAEGAQVAGSIAEQARQEGREWADYVLPAVGAGVGTATIARGAGALSPHIGLGKDMETSIATADMGAGKAQTGGLAASVAKGFVREGALEEMPQSAQEQALQNVALGKPAEEGVGGAAATGLMVGGVMGGGHAAFSREDRRREEPEKVIIDAVTSAPTVDAAIQAADIAARAPLPQLPAPSMIADESGAVGTQAQIESEARRLAELGLTPDVAAATKARGPLVEPPAPEPQDTSTPGQRLLPAPTMIGDEAGTVGTRAQRDANARRLSDLGLTPDVEAARIIRGGLFNRSAPIETLFPRPDAAAIPNIVSEPPAALKPGKFLRFLAENGGLSREEASAQGIDPAHFNDAVSRQVFGKPLFPKQGGMTFDQAAEMASQFGYGSEQYSANEMLDLLDRSLRGEDVLSRNEQFSDIEARMQRALEEYYGGQATEDDDPFRYATPSDFAMSGYTKADEATKDLTALFVVGRQKMGDDAFDAMLERVAAQNDNITDDQLERIIRAEIENNGKAQTQAASQSKAGGRDIALPDAVAQAASGEASRAQAVTVQPSEAAGPIPATATPSKEGVSVSTNQLPPSTKIGSSDERLTPASKRGQADMFGGKSDTAQAVKDADEERKRKAAAAPPVEEGPGDLFSGKSKQTDIDDLSRNKNAPTSNITQTASPPERRRNLEQRKRVSEMSQDELRRELLTDPLTGLPNRRAYDEAPKKAVQIAIDADSLKWVNDNLGHDAGDKMLQAIGQALREQELEAYHISGDEFMVQGDEQAPLERAIEAVTQRLDDADLVAETPDGSTVTKRGVHFSYGIGATRNEADQALNRAKGEREAQGLRAARGKEPPGVTRAAERQPSQIDQAATEEVTPTPSDEGVSASAVDDAARGALDKTKQKLIPVSRRANLEATPSESINRAETDKPVTVTAESEKPETVKIEGFDAEQAAQAAGEANPNGDVAELRNQVLRDHNSADIDDVTEAIHEGQYRGIRKIGESLPAKVLESDISKDLVNRAFNGTSHTPEKRAKVVIRDYVRTMVDAWSKAEENAKTPEDRLRLTEQFRAFKDGYVSRLNAYLSAHGRVMSAFIVGPAKFPTSSNAKKSNTADNRLAELSEWERKGVKRLIEAAKGPADKTPSGELEVARRKMQERQRLQEAMKSANKVVRDKNLSVDQKVEKIIGAGLSEKLAREALKPDFMGRIGFPDYALKNNNAEIHRLTQRVAELEGKQQKAEEPGGQEEVSFDGGTVEIDYADGVLRIRHDTKPPIEARDSLKREGFHWSPRNTAWQRKLTDNAMAATERVLGISLKAPAETGKDTDDDTALFSRTPRDFAKSVDGVLDGAIDEEARIDIGETPAVLRAVGLPDMPLVTTGDVIDKVHYDHGLTREQIKGLPNLLADPVMVFESDTRPGTFVVVTDAFARGAPIIAAVHPNSRFGRAEVNFLASAYPKQNAVQMKRWANSGLLRYVNKSRSPAWQTIVGVQFPEMGPAERGSGKIVLTEADVVKDEDHGQFRRTNFRAKTGVSVDAIDEAIRPLLAKMANAVPVEVVDNYDDLPHEIADRIADEGVDVEGVAHRGRVYLVASQIASVERAKVVLFDHELRHIGLRAMLGADLTRVLGAAWGGKEHGKIRQFARERGIATDSRNGRLEAAEEYVVHLAETGQTNNLLQRVYAAVRDFLRRLGMNLRLSDVDLRELVARAGRAVAEGDTAAPEGALAMSRRFARTAPTFYSQLERVLAAKLPNSGKGKAMVVAVQAYQRKGEVKADEVEWSGVVEWLEGQDNVTKEQVLDFVNANRIEVDEVVREGQSGADKTRLRETIVDWLTSVDRGQYRMTPQNADRLAARAANGEAEAVGDLEAMDAPDRILDALHEKPATKFAQYQLPGGDNYKELLLMLPEKEPDLSQYTADEIDTNTWQVLQGDRFVGNPVGAHNAETAIKIAVNRQVLEGSSAFRSPHFDEPNILAHVRFNERTDFDGKRVLFIEEVQSDWHQKGRREGYRQEINETDRARFDELERRYDAYVGGYSTTGLTNDEGVEYLALKRKVNGEGVVPDAPFKTTWPMLAMKRMIRYAAENGFDRIAWATGSVQADRYDLSKRISDVEWTERQRLLAYDLNRDKVIDVPDVSADKLPDYIGKEAAQKLIDAPWRHEGMRIKRIGGVDLKVGGEGMKAFYDQMLPSMVGKYVKKWGAKVVTAKIDGDMFVDEGGSANVDAVDVHAVDITPAMRDSVIQGQPMFSRVLGDSGRQYTPEQRAAMERTGSTVADKTVKQVAQGLWADAGKKLAQGIVDQFAPVKDISRRAYMLLRLSKGATGAFEAFIKHGKLSLVDGAYDADTSGGVLDRVFVPLGRESTDFLRWIAGNRAERLAREGREQLFTAADIAAFKSLEQGVTDFDYTLANGQVTRDRTLIYRDALAKFNEFNQNALDMAEQSGLIDPDSRHLWEHEFYVPFYRVEQDDGGVRGMNIKSGVVRQEAFRKLKGGEEQLNDLLGNTLMNWAHLIDAAAKNRAAKATLEAAERMGAARLAQPGEKKTVWFVDRGKRVEYKVDDPYLLTAITSLEYAGLRGPAMGAMSAFKHWLTIGVTASPFFKVRNLIRDSVQAIATSDLRYNPLSNVAQGIRETRRDNPAYVSALAGGGLIRFGTMLEGNEAARVRQLIKQGAKDEHILDNESKVRAFYDKYLEPAIAAYNELGNRGEEINRMALYRQLKAKGLSHAEASLAARDLLDFSMAGAWTSIRFLTQVVPFMNARLQGLYKLGRAAKEDPRRFATVVGATTMFSLLLMAAYYDDDDWKKREDWDRDNYWWFKFAGHAFRIPKPFEVGAIASLAERGVELFASDDMTQSRFLRVVGHILTDQLAMNPVPQLMKPVLDVYANKDSFTGRPIETMSMERLEPDYRFTQYTSMVARALSTAGNVISGGKFLSPVQIDHMVRGYFGWLGSFVVGGTDMAVRAVSSEPARPAADYFKTATGGMVQSIEGAPSRYVSQFYEQAKIIEKAYGTYRQLLKDGRVEDAKDYFAGRSDEIRQYRMVSRVKRAESNLNARIRVIERSNLSATEKRMRINEIRRKQDDLARRVGTAGL